MRWRSAVLPFIVASGVVWAGRAAAESVRYVLGPGSRLITRCHGCDPATTRSEPLTGTFDVGILPGAEYAVEALTGVRWSAGGRRITGSGFLQRFADKRVAMVIDTRFGGVPILFTSGRRQPSRAGEIRLQLFSPRGARTSFAITLIAAPEQATAPDTDAGGVSDPADRCATVAGASQGDADGDGIGDACDVCGDSPADAIVRQDGCALEQACPCAGPSAEADWPNQRAYVQCVAHYLRDLRLETKLGKSEIGVLLRDAVRSGCGRHVLAMR
jgi:hypothetical protein